MLSRDARIGVPAFFLSAIGAFHRGLKDTDDVEGENETSAPNLMRCRSGRPHRGCQPAGPVTVRETGLMCANMLRAFQVGKALISDGGPSS
jgi:hypothetical protein